MRFIRTENERLRDLVFSLVLFNACQSESDIGDRLKTTKLLFIATYLLFRQRIHGLSLSFFRYTHGPFTREVYEIWEELSWMGYMDSQAGSSGRLSLTPEGAKAADRLYGLLATTPSAQPFLSAVREISDAWASLDTSDTLSKVYAMSLKPIYGDKDVLIRDMALGEKLTGVLTRREVSSIIAVPQEAMEVVFRAREIARARPVIPEDLADEYEQSLSVTRYLRRPNVVRKYQSTQQLRDAGPV